MTLGSASESVTVRGGAPPLDAESSTIGTAVEQSKVNSLNTMFGPNNKLGIAFRAEFFNLFNLIQWAPPNTAVGSSTFGQVSSIYPGTNPRLSQFGLKFMF
jgi:hypothetical protein